MLLSCLKNKSSEAENLPNQSAYTFTNVNKTIPNNNVQIYENVSNNLGIVLAVL